MHWHVAPAVLVARLYEDGSSYAGEDEYVAVATITLLADGEAYVSATLANLEDALTWKQWWRLAHMLRDQHGVTLIRAWHKSKPFTIDTTRKT